MRNLLGLASLTLAGCVAVPPAPREAPREISLSRYPAAMLAPFASSNGLREPAQIVVRNQSEWNDLWEQITQGHGNPPPAPPANFGRHTFLVAAMGSRPSGGHSIRIERVIDMGDEVQAQVARTLPGSRCGAIAAITSPIDVVWIEQTPKPIRWRVEDSVRDCE